MVLVHAVRHAPELVYRDDIDQARGEQGSRFAYVTFVSREDAPPARCRPHSGGDRATGGWKPPRACKLAPASSQVMLCGNPDMLKDATAALVERGLRKHRRRTPGQITVESFW